MLIDKTHIRWGLISTGVLLLATAGYVVYAVNSDAHPSGGTLIGLLFGMIASAMMIFAGLLAVRNRFPTVRCGSAQFWLRGHLWLGTLSFIFTLFHSGFRFGSTLETVLMIAFIIVIASGLHGLAMQQILPRLLTSRVPMETFGQQIPFLCRRMQAESDMLVAEVCGKLECDHEAIDDAAYNLAMSLGKLRNGKEGTDFQKFLHETYADSSSKKMPTSTVRAIQVEVAPPAETSGAKPAAPKPAAPKPSMKPKAENENGVNDSPGSQGAADRPLSKIEMMRAAAAEKKAEKGSPADKPANPSEGSSEKPPVMQSVERKTNPDPPAQKEAATPPATPPATMTTEVISVSCPICERQLVLPDRSYLGRIARCPQCSQKFVLGGEEESEQPEPPAEQFETPAEESQSTAEQKPEKEEQKPEEQEQEQEKQEQEKQEQEKQEQEKQEQGDKPLSKIEQMRAQAAKKREQNEQDEKPLSKVEQMRTAAAAKKSESEQGDKLLSKIEQMRAQAAKKREQNEQGEKPLSKVEQMRAAAAEKRKQQAAGAQPLSKVEQMRAAAAAKKSESEGGDKPLSKIEQMRAAAAAKKGTAAGGSQGQSKAASATPGKPTRPKPRPKQASVPDEPIPRADLLKSFYLSNVRPYLESDWKPAQSQKSTVSQRAFAQARNDLPPQLHDTLNRLQNVCEERQQFIVQRRLHWLLHSWLLIHIPATIALFVLFIVHVVVALRVIPWNP